MHSWKCLHCVTDLPLRANSRRPTTELRASEDLLFTVSTVSKDVMLCSCSYTVGVTEKLPSPFSVHHLNGVQRSPFTETTFTFF